MNVFLTIDVEIWCDGWSNIDAKFPDAFKKYIYGRTPKGDFGLPYQIDVLREYGLKGVFFVEPLFATHFGEEPLCEITGLLQEGKQEIQLHLHTEWVDESAPPLLDNINGKRQFLDYFTLEEQTLLIAKGISLIEKACKIRPNAFRAGSFRFNSDTLLALAENGIIFDASYNASYFGKQSGVFPGTDIVAPVKCGEVFEYPMTVFRDGTGNLRHTQITAISYREMEHLLWQALESGRDSFVILFHNFEFLNSSKNRPDKTVVRRFAKLCTFLEKNSDCFKTCCFGDHQGTNVSKQPEHLRSPLWMTAMRNAEQLARRASV